MSALDLNIFALCVLGGCGNATVSITAHTRGHHTTSQMRPVWAAKGEVSK